MTVGGYFYDEETGWYYLKSRYYDSEVGRFLNADAIDVLAVEQNSIVQYNLYAYCLNNPVMNVDFNGCFAISMSVLIAAMIGGAIAGALVSAVSYNVSCKKYGTEFSGIDMAKSMLLGGMCGAVGGGLGVFGASALVNVGISALTGIVAGGYVYERTSAVAQNTEINWSDIKNYTVSTEPISSYLGGSTKKNCGPYRRGWTQILYKPSCQRMRSASYFFNNILL